MARYKLMAIPVGEDAYEVMGKRKKTKADIHEWIEDNSRACGFDWRCGYLIKFRNSNTIYEWLNIKDNSQVKM